MCKTRNLVIAILALAMITACSTSGNKAAEEDPSEVTSAETANDPASFGIDTSAELPAGLTPGNKAPGFAGRDISGQSFDLYSELRNGPVVVMFYRGKWCPVCNRYMSAFNDSIQYITQRGARVVAITPELPSNAREFATNTGSEFSIISDPTHTIMDAFDVTFTATEEYQEKTLNNHGVSIMENNGGREAVLPVPATYVIDGTGSIIYSHFDLNYRNRASVSQILEALR